MFGVILVNSLTFLENYSTKKGVKYPFKVQFRSFKSLNIKMSHSVVQKNHLKSVFMLIFGWIIAKLKSSTISKHPVVYAQWEKLYTFRNSFVKVLYKLNRKFESKIHVVKLFPLNFASQKPLQFM